MKNVVIILSVFIVLISCSNSKQENERKIEFFQDDLSGYLEERLIFEIKAAFSECGEWGGHEERLLIYAKKDKEFHLKYELWNANCDSLVEHNDSIGTYAAPLMNLIDSTTFKLNNEHKESILKFTHNLVDAKFREIYSGHAGNSFEIYKYSGYGGSSFKIHVYGFDHIILNDYIELLKILNLEKFGLDSNIKYYSLMEFVEE